MRRALMAACVLVGVLGLAATRADDKPLDPAGLDKRAAKAAYDAAILGTELFNKGNHEGCFRLYQGTLMGLQPLLESRPKLAELVGEQLDKAKDMKPAEGAFELRKALDAVQKETAAALAPPKKSLWDRLGGEKAVTVVVHDFVAAAAADPKVNFTRGGKYKLDDEAVKKLEKSLVEMISAATGGPLKYTGKDMKTVHAGMKITEEEFNAAAGHLVATLKKHQVPQAEMVELLEIVGATRKDIVGQ
jgi:hemoglobin